MAMLVSPQRGNDLHEMTWDQAELSITSKSIKYIICFFKKIPSLIKSYRAKLKMNEVIHQRLLLESSTHK